MSNISIEVEFLVGTDITRAIEEAKAMAANLGIAYVTFKFNGVHLSIGATANIDKAAKEFRAALKNKDSVVSY